MSYGHRAIELMLEAWDAAGREAAALRERLGRGTSPDAGPPDVREPFQALLDVSLCGLVIHEAGTVRAINRAITDLFGYEQPEVVGKSAMRFVAPESRDEMRRQISSGEGRLFEFLGKRRDGSTFRAQVRGQAIRYKGRPARIASIQDVTEHRQAAEKLRASEERLRRLNEELEQRVDTRTRELTQRTAQLESSRRDIDLVLSSMPYLMFVHDADGRFSAFYARQDHPDLLLPPAEFLGRHYSDMLPPTVAEQTRQALHKVLETGERAAFEYSLETPGGRVYFEATLSRIANSAEVLAVVHNITARKRSEAQLMRMEKMAALGQLLAGVAHEINNPVNFIYGNLSLIAEAGEKTQVLLQELLGPAPTDATQRRIETVLGTSEPSEFFDDMKGVVRDCTEGARRVREIVKSLRSFAHPERDRRIPTDIRECLSNALTLLSHEVGARISVVRDFAEVKPVRADPAQLNQVFTNLVLNAIQAIDDEGEIHVIAFDDTEEVVVTVRDTGRGIEETDQDRVFEPFFTTKEIGQGTGLGLAICYGIVEAHGGRIELESTPGRGSTFTVRLPVEQ